MFLAADFVIKHNNVSNVLVFFITKTQPNTRQPTKIQDKITKNFASAFLLYPNHT